MRQNNEFYLHLKKKNKRNKKFFIQGKRTRHYRTAPAADMEICLIHFDSCAKSINWPFLKSDQHVNTKKGPGHSSVDTYEER